MKYSILLISGIALVFTGCSYSQSALEYSYEGTKRVQAGYEAKSKMTESILEYLAKANQDCGVKVEILNGVPVTTVKECIRPADVLASVDKVEMIQPQQVKDMLSSAGDFLGKSTNLFVPLASTYYSFRMNEDNQNANVQMNESNNDATTSMWSAYTGNFQNSTSVSETSVSEVSTTIEKEKDYETSTSITDTITAP